MDSYNKTKTVLVSLVFVGVSMVGTAHADDKTATAQGSKKQAPVAQRAVQQSPIKQAPIKQETVKQETVPQLPVKPVKEKQETVAKLPVKELPAKETVKETPAKPEPVKQEMVKQASVAQKSTKQEAIEKGVSSEEKWVTFFSVLRQGTINARHVLSLVQSSSDNEQVRNYAVAAFKRVEQNDATLIANAEKFGFAVRALRPNERVTLNLMARANGEYELLRSLNGEALNQEFLTLAIGCHGQLIRALDRISVTAPNAEVKAYLADLSKNAMAERDTAQALLDKICESEIAPR